MFIDKPIGHYMEITSPHAFSGKGSLLLACLLVLLSQLPGSVVAQGERDPLVNAPEPLASWQWSGNFQLGYATMQSTDQLSAELENSITQDIHHESDQYNSDLLAPLFDFTYRRGNQKEMYYFRTPVETGLPLTLGYAIDWQPIGIVDISAFTKMNRTAWKNPFLQGEKRKSTSVQDRGITLQINDFFYSYEKIDIEDDSIGHAEKALRRDGNTQSLGYSPKISLGDNSNLQIKLAASQDNMLGESEQAKGASIKLAYDVQLDRFKWVFEAGANGSKYQEKHVVFQQKRDAVGYSGTAMFTWLKPFGYPDLFNTWIVNKSCADSKTDFYDFCTRIVAATLGVTF